jgi:hypothetical protein
MSKQLINRSISERCLLTEVTPYETPILFSNWGSFNHTRNLAPNAQPTFLQALFTPSKTDTIPFKYRIKKGIDSTRVLSLIHPKHSQSISNFYRDFDVYITKLARRSPFSLRAPTNIAKSYRVAEAVSDELREIEDITADRVYASSYFKYDRFSYLYQFFDSDEYANLEKNYSKFLHADIARCFDSIYTHTISWAVKGLKTAKAQKNHSVKGERPFDSSFDKLLQTINYQETNGIPIGPELSRIFAEIILQRIDLNVAERMTAEGHPHGIDYCCYRYVDDIFFFFNEESAQKKFKKALTEELQVYKLHLNPEKWQITERPFITKQSLFKLSVSEFVSSLWSRLGRLRARDSAKEISRLRATCQFNDIGFQPVAALFFSALRKRLKKLDLSSYDNAADILYVIADLAFHAFRMDTSASSSYKVAELVLNILERLPGLADFERAKLNDKLIFELRGVIVYAFTKGYNVEAINALIALREIEVKTAITVDFIHQIIGLCKNSHRDETSRQTRINYFCIVGIVYATGGGAKYAGEIAALIEESAIILNDWPALEYAESAFLLLDLSACPFISNAQKHQLIEIALKRYKPTANSNDFSAFRAFVMRHTWYFHWNNENSLKIHLLKKRLQPSY